MRRTILAVLFLGIVIALLASRVSARHTAGVDQCENVAGMSTAVGVGDSGQLWGDPSGGFPDHAYEGCVNAHENHLSSTQTYFDGSRSTPGDAGFWYMEGFLWNPQFGWLLLDWQKLCQNNAGAACDDAVSQQLKAGTDGLLRGYAWNDNVGWLWFDWTIGGGAPSAAFRARIGLTEDCSGAALGPDDPHPFCGYAWSDRVGWVFLGGLSTTWTPGEVVAACPPPGVSDDVAIVCRDPDPDCPGGAWVELDDGSLACLDIDECPGGEDTCAPVDCDLYPDAAECVAPDGCPSGVIIENEDDLLDDFCVGPPEPEELLTGCVISVSPDPGAVARRNPIDFPASAAPIADGRSGYEVSVEFYDDRGALVDPGGAVAITGLGVLDSPDALPVYLDQIENTGASAVTLSDMVCNDERTGLCTARVTSFAPTSSMNGEDRDGDGLTLGTESYDDANHQHVLLLSRPTVTVDGDAVDCTFDTVWPVDGVELHFQPAAEVVSLFSVNPGESDPSPYIVAQRGQEHGFQILGRSWNRTAVPESGVFVGLRLAAEAPFLFRFLNDTTAPPVRDEPPAGVGEGAAAAGEDIADLARDLAEEPTFDDAVEEAGSDIHEREQELIIGLGTDVGDRNVHQWVTPISALHTGDDTAVTVSARPTLGSGGPAEANIQGVSLTTRIMYDVVIDGVTRAVKYYSSFLPRTFNEVVSPELMARGVISSQTGVFNVQSGSALTSIGDVATNPVRNTVVRNVAGWTKGFSVQPGQPSDVTVAGGEFALSLGTPNCNAIAPQTIGEHRIFYFKDCDVTVRDVTAASWGTRPTIIVEGGNLFIASNLRDDQHAPSFVVLRDLSAAESEVQGNIYIHADVTDLYANMYADGSLLSYTDATGIGRIGARIPLLPDRAGELNNQLYIRGSLSARNSIGGADRTPPIGCFGERDLDDANFLREVATPCDLNFLRSFRLHLRRYNDQPVDLGCVYGPATACPIDPADRISNNAVNAPCALLPDNDDVSPSDISLRACTDYDVTNDQYGDLEVRAGDTPSQGLLEQGQLVNAPVVIHFVPPARESVFRAAQPQAGGRLTR